MVSILSSNSWQESECKCFSPKCLTVLLRLHKAFPLSQTSVQLVWNLLRQIVDEKYWFYHYTESLQTPKKQCKNASPGMTNLILTVSLKQYTVQIETEMRPCAKPVSLLSLPPLNKNPIRCFRRHAEKREKKVAKLACLFSFAHMEQILIIRTAQNVKLQCHLSWMSLSWQWNSNLFIVMMIHMCSLEKKKNPCVPFVSHINVKSQQYITAVEWKKHSGSFNSFYMQNRLDGLCAL